MTATEIETNRLPIQEEASGEIRPYDVKRVRIRRLGTATLLGLNTSAAEGLMGSPTFWDFMREHGQQPRELSDKELHGGLFSDRQVVLTPLEIEGRPVEPLSDDGIIEFARMCVEGKIVREWETTTPREAAMNGVIVLDNTDAMPDSKYDTGPHYVDVLASSIPGYERKAS